MKRLVGEHVEFLRQYRQRFETTGAIAPSSRFLARALTRPIERHRGPVRVLEVGPGTGAVTRRIVRLLKPDDALDLVELNPSFVNVLRRRFADDPHYRRVADRATVHQCPIQEFRSDVPYDYIVCGLPFNNFPPPLVREIFEVLFRLLTPTGVLSYFEYMYMRPLRKLVSNSAGRRRLSELEVVLQEYQRTHGILRDWVFVNLPPAWVHHLQVRDA
ncbi:MAG: methyltransferase domain-containing protein [Planctomycetaceae bacterium]|nr:methyltransferase domain-containing protein [Planctomycetaceae bacterium]